MMLTTVTTFVGLTPLLLERSVQAQFLIPMATSLAFGVPVSAVNTLFVPRVLPDPGKRPGRRDADGPQPHRPAPAPGARGPLTRRALRLPPRHCSPRAPAGRRPRLLRQPAEALRRSPGAGHVRRWQVHWPQLPSVRGQDVWYM